MRPGARAAISTTGALGSRARAWLGSLALHAALGFALVFGAIFTWHTRPEAVHTVAAYVVRGGPAVHEAAPAPTPTPVTAAPEALPPPAPTPPVPDAAARAQAKAEAQAAAQEKAQEKAQAAAAQAAAARSKAQAQAQAQAQAHEAAEAKARQAKAAADAAAEKQKQQAALSAQAAREKAELADRKQRESDLARQLAAEEHSDAQSAAQAGLRARYIADIIGRVQRAWIRPPTARAGLKCIVHVTQVPGGTVTGVRVGECNGDAAVRQSIEAAVYRASPLPPPPDPALFDRNLTMEFSPDA